MNTAVTLPPLPGTAVTLLNGGGSFRYASGTSGAGDGITPSAFATLAPAPAPPVVVGAAAPALVGAAAGGALVGTAPDVGAVVGAAGGFGAAVGAAAGFGALVPPPQAASSVLVAPGRAMRSSGRRLVGRV